MPWSAPGLTIATLSSTDKTATSAGPLLNSLHWLPVHSRINFKIATITYKSLHSQSQATLFPCSTIICRLGISVHPIHCFFLPTQQKTNFDLHAFQSAAPNIWNKLLIDVKSACSISSFKAHLKTHYFQHTS